MQTLGICLAFGDLYEDAGRGALREPQDGGIARILQTMDVARNYYDDPKAAMFVCSAGYSRQEPQRPQSERQVSLADQMNRYYKETKPEGCKAVHRPFFLAVPRCWGTRNEIRLGMKLGCRRFASRTWPTALIISSNRAHLLRVRICLWLYKPPAAWQLVLVPVKHHFSLMSHLTEPLKIVRDLWYIARVWMRLRRRRKAA